VSRHNNGLSTPEISRFTGSILFLRKWWPDLWLLTTNKGTSRDLVAAIWKRITKLQGGENLPLYSVVVFETTGGLHGNIAFLGTDDIAERLKTSCFGEAIHLQRVYDPANLYRDYLAKERTVQAGWKRTDLGRRRPGSHKLPGGGDRVRPSDELARDALDAGMIVPWRRTNAKRSDKRKNYRLRGSGPLARAPQPAGQLSLLPEIERLPSRLHDFGGGYIPPAVALEIEFRRAQLGLSQRQVGKLIGRSQGQLANALRGHDPIGATAINRLRELFLKASKVGPDRATHL
jgi:hypothetical protein